MKMECILLLDYSFTTFNAFNDFADLNMLVSVAAIITLAAQFIFIFNFFYSIFRGRLAPANPWKSNTLEWTTPRFPGHGNWPGEIPAVYRWPVCTMFKLPSVKLSPTQSAFT